MDEAIVVDIETELSSIVKKHGGRHPLPSVKELKNTFENIGISNDSIVISYDEGDLAGASRLWWILKYLGHEKAYVLDGGLEAFKELGGEISTENEKSNKGKFTEYCNGKVTQECIRKGKQSKDPAVRKRATFADNVRKWKHENGGSISYLSLFK